MSAPWRAEPPGRVREAEPRDLDRLAALWTEIADHHAPLDPLYALQPGAGAEIRSLMVSVARDPDAAIFVHETDGYVDGFCSVRIDCAPPIFQETERAEITDLGVSAGRRRRGIGRALVGAALDWVAGRGVERVEVRVAAPNAEGQSFWRALGFGDCVDVLQRRL